MSQPFKVVSFKPQKTTGTQKLPAPLGQFIQFTGSLTDGDTWDRRDFVVLAGEGAPTVTGGFAKWNVISRPQRVGMTVLDGYDPITMVVPIRFDNVVRGRSHRPIEDMVGDLEWMAGRGLHFGNVGHAAQGDSPLVQVFTTDSHGKPTPLIPAPYQTPNLYWVIADLAFDSSPLRNRDGHRIRQDVTVTLLEHVSGPGTSFDSPAVRAAGRAADAGTTSFSVTAENNTIRKIMIRRAHNPDHAAAVAVVDLNRKNKKLRLSRSVDQDLTKHLPLGTKIKVPNKYIK